mgnify:FL=1
MAFICGIKLVSKNMTLLQLQAVLRIIYAHERVIGVDVTGECSSTLDYFTEVKDAGIDSKTNEELIRMIVSENQEKSVCVNV